MLPVTSTNPNMKSQISFVEFSEIRIDILTGHRLRPKWVFRGNEMNISLNSELAPSGDK
jgi:hypothetical protein